MYRVRDIETQELLDEEFDTYEECLHWCEENGIDFDYYEIVKRKTYNRAIRQRLDLKLSTNPSMKFYDVDLIIDGKKVTKIISEPYLEYI